MQNEKVMNTTWHERATAQVHIPKTEANLTTYKFRCEFPHDAWAFHQAALEYIYTMHLEADHEGPGGTEPVVTVEVAGISMDELRTIMESISDGHVMVETLETPENYTGERNYAGGITSTA